MEKNKFCEIGPSLWKCSLNSEIWRLSLSVQRLVQLTKDLHTWKMNGLVSESRVNWKNAQNGFSKTLKFKFTGYLLKCFMHLRRCLFGIVDWLALEEDPKFDPYEDQRKSITRIELATFLRIGEVQDKPLLGGSMRILLLRWHYKSVI